MSTFEVPELARQRALTNGEAGTRWLRDVRDIACALAQRWDLQLGTAFNGGTTALVIAATRPSGSECVLKVARPFDDDGGEIYRRGVLTHQLAAGQGCAELIAHDEPSRALLMERLGDDLGTLGFNVPQILQTITTTLQTFWRPLPEDCALPTGADATRWLAENIVTFWDQLGQHHCWWPAGNAHRWPGEPSERSPQSVFGDWSDGR